MNRLRILNIEAPSAPDRPAFVTSASGLVKVGKSFYVVADDELHFGVFPAKSKKAGRLYSLFPGTLPSHPKKRKKKKPDLEALIFLDTTELPASGSLLAVPSGSKKNRVSGSLIRLHDDGTPFPEPQKIDFRNLYRELSKTFADLNIEAAVSLGKTLRLFQRGNGASRQNATIDLDMGGVIDDIRRHLPLNPSRIERIKNHNLGKLRGVPLSFTDACLAPTGEIVFLAAAEATESTYLDGEFIGSVVGVFDKNGKIKAVRELGCPFKAEGIWVSREAGKQMVYAVTDADDATVPSTLYRGVLTW